MMFELTAEEALIYVRKRKKLLDERVILNFEVMKAQSRMRGIDTSLNEMDRDLRSETPKLVID